MRGVFVAGTDTGVGKTILAAAICAALAARGERVAAFKPAVTGLDDDPPRGFARDHELLASVASAGQSAEDVSPLRYGPPLSPHYAATLAGEQIEPTELLAKARNASDHADALVCEGVGGLLVPLTPGYLIRDLALDLGLPLVVAARPGLGTINHTLLTLEAARTAGVDVRGVVMTPWPEGDALADSNRATVELIGDVPVSGLPPLTRDGLAAAGAQLPLDSWL
ncbi:MAG TPA: dethiobiotin synthase [Thermoleophilaceae bacterium]